jgi:hypothetical protein
VCENTVLSLFGHKTKEEGKKGSEDEEEDVTSYWMTLRNGKVLELKDEGLDCTFRRSLFGSGLSVRLRGNDDIRKRRKEVNGDCKKL